MSRRNLGTQRSSQLEWCHKPQNTVGHLFQMLAWCGPMTRVNGMFKRWYFEQMFCINMPKIFLNIVFSHECYILKDEGKHLNSIKSLFETQNNEISHPPHHRLYYHLWKSVCVCSCMFYISVGTWTWMHTVTDGDSSHGGDLNSCPHTQRRCLRVKVTVIIISPNTR